MSFPCSFSKPTELPPPVRRPILKLWCLATDLNTSKVWHANSRVGHRMMLPTPRPGVYLSRNNFSKTWNQTNKANLLWTTKKRLIEEELIKQINFWNSKNKKNLKGLPRIFPFLAPQTHKDSSLPPPPTPKRKEGQTKVITKTAPKPINSTYTFSIILTSFRRFEIVHGTGEL